MSSVVANSTRLCLDQLTPPLTVEVIRSRRRSMELRLYPDRRAQVRVPQASSERQVRAFIDSKQPWLQRRLAALPPPPPLLCYQPGERHLFLGDRYPLVFCHGPQRSVRCEQQQLLLTAPTRLTSEQSAALLHDWYRQQARGCFNALIDQHMAFFAARGYQRPQLRIRAMRSRWGSLSGRGNINLNLHLIRTPLRCIEYVVVHELCHLEQMNHGPSFRALMTEILPDWQKRKQQLNLSPLI